MINMLLILWNIWKFVTSCFRGYTRQVMLKPMQLNLLHMIHFPSETDLTHNERCLKLSLEAENFTQNHTTCT